MNCYKVPSMGCDFPDSLAPNICSSCIEDIKGRAYKTWTDGDIDLIIHWELLHGEIKNTSNKVIERGKNLRMLREMDKIANIKLKNRYEILKEND